VTVPRRFQIELPARPEWESIEPLRQSVVACLRAVFRDLPICESLAMVAGELLENAVKFGARATGREPALALWVVGDEFGVGIEVSSQTRPSDPGVARLVQELERIRRAPSPREAYLDALRRVALSGGEGGLGLARIAHEGGCDLSAVEEDGLVRVRANTRLLRPLPPTPAPPA
jgi:hypothetical protein